MPDQALTDQTPMALSAGKERLVASIVNVQTAPFVNAKGHCPFCGRGADAPRKAYRDGALYECCVGEAHDAHVSDPEHAEFVARARAAGLDGKW